MAKFIDAKQLIEILKTITPERELTGVSGQVKFFEVTELQADELAGAINAALFFDEAGVESAIDERLKSIDEKMKVSFLSLDKGIEEIIVRQEIFSDLLKGNTLETPPLPTVMMKEIDLEKVKNAEGNEQFKTK